MKTCAPLCLVLSDVTPARQRQVVVGGGEVDSQFVALLLHQHSLQLHARGGGAALPFLLAAHLHPSAARLHAGYSLLSHSLPGGAAVQLFTQTEGAACGRGQYCCLWFPFIFPIFSLFLYWIRFWQIWFLLSLLINSRMWLGHFLCYYLIEAVRQLPKAKVIINYNYIIINRDSYTYFGLQRCETTQPSLTHVWPSYLLIDW